MLRTSARASDSLERCLLTLKKNKLTMLIAAFFFAGMLYGALLVGFGEKGLIDSLDFITKGYVESRTEQSLLVTFGHSFCSSGIFILVLFVLGFSAVSIPVIVFLPLFKGLGLGVSIGYLYTVYAVKGAAFCAVLVLPAALFSTFAIILAGRESLKLSLLFLSSFVPRINGTISPRGVKLYCAKFLVLLAIVIISSLIDCVTTFLFAGFLVL